jgi:hypothetical protein
VYERDQAVERRLVSGPPGEEESSDIARITDVAIVADPDPEPFKFSPSVPAFSTH